MKNPIFQSATKICLIAITAALIAGLFLNKIDGKDFIVLSTMVFTFYFGNKNAPKAPDTTTIDVTPRV